MGGIPTITTWLGFTYYQYGFTLLFTWHIALLTLEIMKKPQIRLFGGGLGGCVQPDELPLEVVLAAAWAQVRCRCQRCCAVGLLSSWQPWGSAPGFASAEAWQIWQHGKMGYNCITV
jgi:hypothetical protein